MHNSGGLITSLMLSESYVIHVLGFDQSILREGRYNIALQQQIFEAHLIAENWLKDGLKYLKDKGVEGYEAVKDKALDVKDAIKQYGSDVKGVVAALTQMVSDPKEAEAYKSGIFGNIRNWPRSVLKNLAKIAKWLEDHSMPTFAKGVRKIIDALKAAYEIAKSTAGWMGSMSMIAFGLATRYIEEEFGIREKVTKAASYIRDGSKILGDLKDAGLEAGSEVVDDIKDFFSGKIQDVVENSELFEKIKKFLIEKLGFIEVIKKKFIDITKKVTGKAVESFAGPLSWIKTVAELFQDSAWVVKNTADILTRGFTL